MKSIMRCSRTKARIKSPPLFVWYIGVIGAFVLAIFYPYIELVVGAVIFGLFLVLAIMSSEEG